MDKIEFAGQIERVMIYHKTLITKTFDLDLNYSEVHDFEIGPFKLAISALCDLPALPHQISFLGWVKAEYWKIKRRQQQTTVDRDWKEFEDSDEASARYQKLLHQTVLRLNSNTYPTYREFWEPIETGWKRGKTQGDYDRIMDHAENLFKLIKDGKIKKPKTTEPQKK